jgi:hypothetical protein
VREVEAEDGGIERAAQVVEIRDEERRAAPLDEALEQAALLEGVGKVAVAGGVLARTAFGIEKKAAVAREAERQMLREGGDSLAVAAPAERGLDAGFRGRARHEPERRRDAVAPLERRDLGEP